MKKTILFSSALVALAMLASCQKEEFIETPATATGVTEFTATIESTKTTIASDGKVTWTAGDEITVTDAESKSAVYVAASSASSTTFTLKDEETPVGDGPYKATYGDITKQKYSATGANCPLSAKTTDASSKNLKFSSPYAVLKITAQSSNAEVIKTVAVTYGNNSYYLDCSEKNVALTSTGVDFYVAVEPAKNAELGVAFYNTADKMAKKTRNESISLNAKDLFPVKFDLSSSTWTTPTTTNTFKAVYKGDDGSLTFYYDDNSLHIGEGVLYDKLPIEATINTSWGYDGIRGNIKSVKIDPSVAGYQGLTSTAFMFYNMTKAESISGAENLDVSNVTNMSSMFNSFGKESTSLTDVPDVSEWDTGNVKDMKHLFYFYGYNSKNLTTPPDVSEWDTGRVTDMTSMFSGYGKNSTSLTDVPDVSGWKTDNVKKMGNLFANYGDASEINCVLDLTGWNLAELTTGNVFNLFSPNTFKVTIPAKTGENPNLPSKWYGSGTHFFTPPTNNKYYFTPALAGVFSVSDAEKVHFSKGNLWYGKVDDKAEKATFNFEAEQYSISSSWDTAHVSNFYWSKTASVAYAESYNESGTSASDVFFTDATDFTVGGQTNVWRTLSRDEWEYLFEHHEPKYVSVNGKSGIVIAPDGFSGTIANSYDATAWATAESNGLVFLPNTGYRTGTSIDETDISCIYWTSTASGNTEDFDQPTAYRMFFQWKNSSLDHRFDEPGLREWAVGIRLVTE